MYLKETWIERARSRAVGEEATKRAGLDSRAPLARGVAARVLVLADGAGRAAALVRELARRALLESS